MEKIKIETRDRYEDRLSLRSAITKSMAEATVRIFFKSSVLKSVESKNKTKAAAIKPQNSMDFLLENRLILPPPFLKLNPGFGVPGSPTTVN